VSFGLPRRAQAGVAVGVALTFLAMASSPALADRVRSQEWWLRTLHVTRAWRSTQGAGVTVALLDTGVDAKQADLVGSVITGPDYTHSGRTPGGAFWGVHGTEMASVIAGHGHGAGNGAGVMGVAPQAKILSVRVTLESNDPLLTNATVAAGLPNAIARGISYAVKHHAAVIDLPVDPVTASGAAGSGGSRAERAAVAYANARHVVLVAPAGDGGAGSNAVNYPAAYPGVISVGAFNEKFVKAPYSSRRPYVTLTAPGDGVTAASGLKTYAQVHSTSAASAVVAGIAALIKAQFPKLSSARVRQVLTTSTVYRPKGGQNDGSGYGTVDAAAALMAASKLVEAVPAAATGASAGTQTPPTAPAVHSTVIRKNLGHSLMTDVAIAGAVFLVLLGAILGFASWRRRRARSARLAVVRAATQVPARRTGKPAAKGNPFGNGMPVAGESGPVIAGNALENGGNAMGNAAWPPARNPMAGRGLSGAGFTGSGTPGTGFTGSGTPGAWMSGGVTPGADGHAAGMPARATSQPQIEPVGFVPAPLVPGSEQPGYGTSGPGSPDHAPGGSGGASEDPAADSPAQVNAPPWAPIQTDPSARSRSGDSAAIPTSAFPGPAASAGAEPPGDPGDAERAPGRRAQGTHRGPVRTPPVGGSPPWGPAPQPDSELPWTQAPTPPRGDAGLLARQPARPEMPTWDAMAEEAWPGGPRVAKPHPPSASPADSPSGLAGHHPGRPAGPPPRPADPRPTDPRPTDPRPAAPRPDGQQQAGQPIYPLNPDTTAEAPGVTSPKPGLGFLRGARPTGTTWPPSVRPGAGPSDAKPKTGVPPWEITDSFLAMRTERPGAARDDGSVPAAPAVPDENAGFPRDGGSFPSRPAEPPRVPGGSDLFSRSTGTPSFPSSGASFPASPAEPGGFPDGGPSFPSATSGFPRASSFPRTPDQTPGGARTGSFPGTPGETPSFPRGGRSFPGGPAQPPGSPGATLPGRGAADAPGENTENIPAVAPPSGEEKLPRRIPLSERPSGFPPVPRRHDDDAFRLFPFGKDAETPPSDNNED
jgi:Subtilase family